MRIFDKMSTQELKARIKYCNRMIVNLRFISLTVYAIFVIAAFLFLHYKFAFTSGCMFILLIFVLIFSAVFSGFEAMISDYYTQKDEINITISNRKEYNSNGEDDSV